MYSVMQDTPYLSKPHNLQLTNDTFLGYLRTTGTTTRTRIVCYVYEYECCSGSSTVRVRVYYTDNGTKAYSATAVPSCKDCICC